MVLHATSEDSAVRHIDGLVVLVAVLAEVAHRLRCRQIDIADVVDCLTYMRYVLVSGHSHRRHIVDLVDHLAEMRRNRGPGGNCRHHVEDFAAPMEDKTYVFARRQAHGILYSLVVLGSSL